MKKLAHFAPLVLLGLLFASSSAHADNWTVTDLSDSDAGSLRAAVGSATSGDTITFAPGLSGTLYITSGAISINSSVTITGPSAGKITISSSSHAFSVPSGSTVAISGLTFANCSYVNYPGGGAILNYGTLAVSDSIFSGNAGDAGGAIYSNGTITVIGSTFTQNNSYNAGGAIAIGGGFGSIQNSTFATNIGSNAGAIYVNGNVSITNSTFTNNQGFHGGAIYVDGNVSITNSTFTGNQGSSGGAVYNDSGVVNITNSTIAYNMASGNGGGVRAPAGSIIITSSIVAENTVTDPDSNAIVGADIDFTSGVLKSGGSNLVGDGSTTGFVSGSNHDQIGTTASPINPLVAALANNGGLTPTVALLKGSPAIDADYNAKVIVDQRNVHRPQGVRNDIGAFEFVPGVLPVVTAFTPASGSTGTLVTITGSGFSGATAVSFNGVTSPSIAIASDTAIVAMVPGNATTGPIGVKGSAGTGSSSNVFTVLTAAPKITGFTPVTGPAGTQVTVLGSGFTGVSSVTFGGVAATMVSITSDTALVATVPTGAKTGKISITAPGGVVASGGTFTVTASPPTITSFTPATGPAGTVVTITGTNLTGTTAVSFHGSAGTAVTVLSATSVKATVPAGATTGTITLTTPGGSAASSTSFTVTALPPTVTTFQPAKGTVGTTVIILGTNLTGTSAVKFHGLAAASFKVISNDSLSAVVPTGATSGTVAVTTPVGTATSASPFTVTASPPTITSFTPATGPAGTVVTITGTNLTGTTAVSFHGSAGTAVTVLSATSVKATVPAGATTGTITLTTPGGSAASPASFTVTASPPTISAFAPSSGPVGTTVLITGTNLTGSTVKFNGTTAKSVKILSSTAIQAIVAAGTTTGTIAVTTPGGTIPTSTSYTVTP